MSMSDYLYNALPVVYRTEDINLNQNQPLKRFLQVFGVGFDAIKADIDAMQNLLDVASCPDKYLPYLAASIGIEFPYDMTSQEQRRFIKAAPTLYKMKGTLNAFTYLARELTGQAFQATIIENRDWVAKTNSLTNKTFATTQGYTTATSTVSFTPGPTYNKKSFQLFLTASSDTENLNNLYTRLQALYQFFAPAGTNVTTSIVYYYSDAYNSALITSTELIAAVTETNTLDTYAETWSEGIFKDAASDSYSDSYTKPVATGSTGVTNSKFYVTNLTANTVSGKELCVDVITNLQTGQVTTQIA